MYNPTLAKLIIYMQKNNFNVESSHGTWEISWSTGLPVNGPFSIESSDKSDEPIIIRFDVAEFKEKYKNSWESCKSVDILDIGYWYQMDGEYGYEKPSSEWREKI